MIKSVRRRGSDAPKLIAAGAVFIAALSGCTDHNSSDTVLPPKVLPTTLPTTFDTCHEIPSEIFTERAIDPKPHSEEDLTGGDNIASSEIQRKGCTYLRHAEGDGAMGVDVVINVTNGNVDHLKAGLGGVSQYREISIDGHKTGVMQNDTYCKVLVDIKDGGLNFDMADQGDPCQFLIDLASAVVPLLPKE